MRDNGYKFSNVNLEPNMLFPFVQNDIVGVQNFTKQNECIFSNIKILS